MVRTEDTGVQPLITPLLDDTHGGRRRGGHTERRLREASTIPIQERGAAGPRRRTGIKPGGVALSDAAIKRRELRLIRTAGAQWRA